MELNNSGRGLAGCVAARRARASRVARYLGGLDPELPRAVWVLQIGTLLNWFGTGMVVPFTLIYLHDVRGFALATAGLVAATFGAASIFSTIAAGSLVDRLGARGVLVGATVVLAAGYGLFPLVAEPWHGFLLMGVAGIGNGALWPSSTTFMIGITPEHRRHAAFGLNRIVGNLGLGLGGLAGGLIAATGIDSAFTLLFLADAATFLCLAGLVRRLPAPPAPERAAEAPTGSYRDVLRNRPFLCFLGLNTIFVAAGYAQLEASLPIFAKHQAGVGEAWIGALFLANVLVIVVAQMPICRLLEGRRRMRALALMSVLWAVAWLVAAATGLAQTPGAAGLILIVAVGIFGLGECLHGPVSATVAADLAPAELRGRYMALNTNSIAIGMTLGPAAAGLLLGLAPGALFPAAAVACAVAGALGLALERRLPESVRTTPGEARPLWRRTSGVPIAASAAQA